MDILTTPIENDFIISCSDAEEVIGVGLTGGVVRCTRRADGASFALKFLPMNASSKDELHAWRACTPHPHIVPLVAVYATPDLPFGHALLGVALHTPQGILPARAPGRYYIAVMPDMEGGDLFEFVADADAAVNETVAATMMAQCTAAVAHMHACGFLHGDIKLENFLLRRPLAHSADAAGVHVALCDFGFAREFAVQPRPVGRRFTVTYVAPEMVASLDSHAVGAGFQPVGPACDTWALGVAAHILLSQTMPFAPRRGEPGWDDNETITPHLRRTVCEGRYPALPAARSGEAHAFVRELLCPVVSLRATAAQAAMHAWLALHAVVLAPAAFAGDDGDAPMTDADTDMNASANVMSLGVVAYSC